MQAQKSLIGLHIEMIVNARWFGFGAKGQRARHAQMQQQQTLVHVQQQILATAANAKHCAAFEGLHRQPQRPAQGLSQACPEHTCPSNRGGKTQTGDFNLG